MRRDTSTVVPARHLISGAPLGSPMTTYRHGRERKPIRHVAIESHLITDATSPWKLWSQLNEHAYVYRTVSHLRDDEDGLSSTAVIASAAVMGRILDIGARARKTTRGKYVSLDPDRYRALCAEAALGHHAMVDAYSRYPGTLHDHLMLTAPITCAAESAHRAAAMQLSSRELAASVRAEHGRWVVETGVGAALQFHGTCATQEEALVVARAIRDRAWITAVESILEARHGSLDWGEPVTMPYEVQIYE